jgi:tripartite-type tricarboxylate transporter receptor subunit TctC
MPQITRTPSALAAFAAALPLLVACGAALAQPAGKSGDFPVKPVRIVVPLATGGGSDIVARIVAQALSEAWGHSVVVDNRPGAGSTIGTAIVAKAAPDGYTLLVSSSAVAIAPAIYQPLPFDTAKDLAPISLLASQPSVLAVHASVPAQSVRELLALARAKPGQLSYGSAGAGSATHLGSELFRFMAKIDLLHVPYKSAGLATNALLAGETQMLVTNMASVLPHAKAGKLRVLGITSAKRSALLPDVPTVAEAGLPGYEYLTWYGMLAPAGVPAARIARIQADVAKLLRVPAWQERFTAQGIEVIAGSPAEFATFLRSELARWAQVVAAAGIKPE